MRVLHDIPLPLPEGAGGGGRHERGRIAQLIYRRPLPLAPSRKGRGDR